MKISGDEQIHGILGAVVRFSLRFKGIIITLALILSVYSLYTLTKAKYDVFPEFAPPQVVIHAEAPGLSPEQVEVLVTRPIESAINGVEGIESIRSSSIQGFSATTVKFRSGSNIYLARQMIAERLSSLVGQLPQGIRAPVMTPLTSSTDVVLVLGLTSNKRTLMDMRTVADWTVKRTLLAVPGVAKIAVFGGDVKQFQIQIQPRNLIKYNLSVEDVLTAARRATGIMGAGFIDSENQRVVLQAEGQSLTPEQLRKTILLHKDGVNVTLGDIANVVYAPEPPIGASAIMGNPGIILEVSAQYGANTVEVTKKLEQAIKEIRPTLTRQDINLYPALFRPASFIETAIRNVQTSLLIGAVLVVIILFLFLFNFRTAAISCTAIPLSLLTAATILQYLGFSLNTMTLGGLAIAIGEVVDDAIIDVENILRRLRENQHLKNPHPVIKVIYDASIEVRSAVVYATFAVVLVFIPILTISGVTGRIFEPLGLAYILAILASLIVALTVTPALCFLLLGHRDLPEKESPIMPRLKERYRKNLLRVEKHPKAVVGIAAIFIIAVLGTIPFLSGGFLPELKEGNFIIHISAVPGTSLDESLRIGRQITLELLKLPFVSSVAQRAGRAEQGEETRGTNSSELAVSLKPLNGKQTVFARQEIRKIISRFPGISYSVNTFLTERIEETVSGYTAPVAVNVYGNDLDILEKKAQEIAAVLGKVRGASEVQVQAPPGTPQLMIKLRKSDLERWGFEPVDVLEVINTAYQGNVIGQVYEEDRVFDISVILDQKDRKSIADIGSLPLRNSSGTYLYLRQLADIYETSGRNIVMHDGTRRVQTVTCNVTGRSNSSFTADAKKQISSAVGFPPGTYVEFTGTAEAQAQSRRDLVVHSLLAGIGIIILLSIVLGHYRNLLLVLLNLPFALVGGVLVVLAMGGRLSIGSMVGFVTLFGITLRNSIMMISHYEHLVSVEGMTWGLEAAIRGASERLAPILMTASVTAFGLLPLAIGSGTAGREIEGPMALVILGGLVTSTALNLLVLPTLSLRYGRFKRRESQDEVSRNKHLSIESEKNK
jgi:CzcA family heavy metal efflux pump